MSFPNVKVMGFRGYGSSLPFNGPQTYNVTPYERRSWNMGGSTDIGNYQNNPLLLSQTHYWPRWYRDPHSGQCKPTMFIKNIDPQMKTFPNLFFCENDGETQNPLFHYHYKPQTVFKGKLLPYDYKDLYGNKNINLWLP